MIKYNENEFYTKNVLRDNGSIWTDKKQPREEFEPFAIEGKEMAITTNSKFPYVRMLEGKRNTFGWVIDVGSRYANNASYRDINYPIIARGLSAWLLSKVSVYVSPFLNTTTYTINAVNAKNDYISYLLDSKQPSTAELEYIIREEQTYWLDCKSHLERVIPNELYASIEQIVVDFLGDSYKECNPNEDIVACFQNRKDGESFCNAIGNCPSCREVAKQLYQFGYSEKLRSTKKTLCKVLTKVFGKEYKPSSVYYREG